MNLKNLSNEELTLSLKKTAHTERKIMRVVLQHILEVIDRSLYEIKSYSLLKYLMKTCGYFEACAHQRIHAAHLLKSIPRVAETFESGALNLTQIMEVQRSLKHEKKKSDENSEALEITKQLLKRTETILEKIEYCNGFQTKQILAKEFDLPIQHFEKVLPRKDESVTTQMNFNKEDFETIQQLKSLMSHIVPDGSLSKMFTILAKEKLKSKKGIVQIQNKELEGKIRTAKAAQIKNTKLGQSEAGSVLSKLSPRLIATKGTSRNRRIYISVRLKHELFQKAEHQCEYVSPKGDRCESDYQLQKDHRIPLASGGSDDPENLRILCGAHNNLAARNLGLRNRSSTFAKSQSKFQLKPGS